MSDHTLPADATSAFATLTQVSDDLYRTAGVIRANGKGFLTRTATEVGEAASEIDVAAATLRTHIATLTTERDYYESKNTLHDSEINDALKVGMKVDDDLASLCVERATLTAEVERLRGQLRCSECTESAVVAYNKQAAEVERLREENATLTAEHRWWKVCQQKLDRTLARLASAERVVEAAPAAIPCSVCSDEELPPGECGYPHPDELLTTRCECQPLREALAAHKGGAE